MLAVLHGIRRPVVSVIKRWSTNLNYNSNMYVRNANPGPLPIPFDPVLDVNNLHSMSVAKSGAPNLPNCYRIPLTHPVSGVMAFVPNVDPVHALASHFNVSTLAHQRKIARRTQWPPHHVVTASRRKKKCIGVCVCKPLVQVRIPNSELFARITELEARLHVYRSSSGVSSHAPKRLAPRTAPEAGRSLKNLSLVGDERIAMFLGKHNSAPTAGLDVATDVDFGPIRSNFFRHRAHVGLCLLGEQLAALAVGETTSAVDPVLLHVVHLWGTMLQEDNSFKYYLEDVQLKKSLNQLKDISSTHNMNTALQGTVLLGKYFWVKGDRYRAREYLLKGFHLILQHNFKIQDLQNNIEYGTIATRSSSVDLGAVCQLIYLDLGMHILFGGPLLIDEGTIATVNIIPSFYAHLDADVFCVAARTVSIVYCYQIHRVLSRVSNPSECCEIGLNDANNDYWDLIAKLESHLDYIRMRILEGLLTSDESNTRCLRQGELMTLFALAELYAFPWGYLKSRRTALDLVQDIVRISHTFTLADYDFLDPSLSVIWKTCVRILKQDATSTPPLLTAEDTSNSIALIRMAVELYNTKVTYCQFIWAQ